MKRPAFKDFILFESEDFIVINKPPGLSTLEDRAMRENVLAMAREYVSSAQVCHRLDKDTSGCLLIATNPEAYRHASMQFQRREIQKTYHAIVMGVHDFSAELFDGPIRKLGNGKVCIDKREGKESETIVTTLHAYRHYSLLECKPVTGRMHQIRIHLSAAGAPISGDTTYGGELLYLSRIKRKYHVSKGEEERPLTHRLALHAQMISFSEINGSKMSVEAPYPKDFAVVLRQLEKNDRA